MDISQYIHLLGDQLGKVISELESPAIFESEERIRTEAKARRAGSAYGGVMADALEAVILLAERYRVLAEAQAAEATDECQRVRLKRMAASLARVPAAGATTLHEAVQAFVLLWQVMAVEQAPNPYAFSVGNLDRVLEPYWKEADTDRDEAVQLVRHLLTFFQVGSRCWAISQNLIVGGRDEAGRDLASEMTYVVLDAFFDTNDPQPALSVKLHANTPERFYRALGRFFFTPGHSTPSVFNDDSMFANLRAQGVAPGDLPDYAIAGCQEPLIMGKASLNTTNTWLNLAKVLELAANDGVSLISGRRIGPTWAQLGLDGVEQAYAAIEETFFRMLDWFLPRMQDAGNRCTRALGEEKPVPFCSAVMDSFHTGRDMRDPAEPGTRYSASGCLIHGLSVVADSLHAVQVALRNGQATGEQIRSAIQNDFKDAGRLQAFLKNQSKFGNNSDDVDAVAARIAARVSDRVSSLRNPMGKPFLADWSTPSTHLLYGYWVGATPDGRAARSMLGYGLDPRPEASRAELPERFLSAWKLPYLKMTGGYASHIGLRPDCAARADSLEDKGLWMRDRILRPLLRLGETTGQAPFYAYFNIDTAAHLRQVLADPARHAPTGIYIMRIHGTFVNFLDLSPAIQEDIICRLEGVGG
ncbi:MAG: pyruvate formate lyase family protein [Planctomycetota bacterium]